MAALKELDTTLDHLEPLVKNSDLLLLPEDERCKNWYRTLKTLYDTCQATCKVKAKSTSLRQMVVDGFELDQIWEELELKNHEVLRDVRKRFKTLQQSGVEEEKGEEMLFQEEEQEQKEEAEDRLHPDSESEYPDFPSDQSEAGSASDEETLPYVPVKFDRTEVDDQFFQLREMEQFLDSEDQKETGEGRKGEEMIDLFQGGDSDQDVEDEEEYEEKGDTMYRDFFDPPSVTSGEKSEFEKEEERLRKRIARLEEENLAEKPWQLKGETSASTRPENALLEEYLTFDTTMRQAPVMTEEVTQTLEQLILQRVKDRVWDDVVRKEKPAQDPFSFKKKLVLDQEKSKLSLAKIYEQEYLKAQEAEKEEKENPEHTEIRRCMESLFRKLDALSNFHYIPKPIEPEVKVVSNLPAITVEEVAPTSVSDATLLAPEEVKAKQKGELKVAEEKTKTDRKRERRWKKQQQREKRKDREHKALLKAGKVPRIKGKREKQRVKNTKLTSSSHFFSRLQEEVTSHVLGHKGAAKKKALAASLPKGAALKL